jgi:hypothetical protein
MKAFYKALLYGAGVWAAAFITAMLIFPIHETERPLFESIMPVVLTASTVFFTAVYFSKLEINFLKEGIYLGIIWLIINIGIDMLMFSWGPMKMSFIDYIKDIGLTYILIPVITIGMGFSEERILNKFLKGVPPAH